MEEATEVQEVRPSGASGHTFSWQSSWEPFVLQPFNQAVRVGLIWWLTSTSLEYTVHTVLHIVLFTLACVLAKFWSATWKVRITDEGIDWKAYALRRRLKWTEIVTIDESQKHGLSLAIQSTSGLVHLPIFGVGDLTGLRHALRERGYLMARTLNGELKQKYTPPPITYALLMYMFILFGVIYSSQITGSKDLTWIHIPILLPLLCFFPLVPQSYRYLFINDSVIKSMELFPFMTKVRLDQSFILNIDDEKLVVKRGTGASSLGLDLTIPRNTARFDEILALLQSKKAAQNAHSLEHSNKATELV